MEVKLEVWDSPNSAGVVIDAIRCMRLGLDHGLTGTLEGPASYFMKSPPVQYADDVAHDLVEEFIRRYGLTPAAPAEPPAPAAPLANGHEPAAGAPVATAPAEN